MVLQVRDGAGLNRSGCRPEPGDGKWWGYGHISKEESTEINEVNRPWGPGFKDDPRFGA